MSTAIITATRIRAVAQTFVTDMHDGNAAPFDFAKGRLSTPL